MAKRNLKNAKPAGYVDIPIAPKGLSELESFNWIVDKMMKKGYSEADSVVMVLSVVNASSLGIELTYEKMQEYMELCAHIQNDYGEDVARAIEENWPWRPRLYRLCESYMDAMDYAMCRNAYEKLTEKERNNFQTIFDHIWRIRKDRSITAFYSEEDGIYTQCVTLEHWIPRDELDTARSFLFRAIMKAIIMDGVLILRLTGKDKKTTTYGIEYLEAQPQTLLARETYDFLAEVEMQQKGETYERAPLLFLTED